MKELFGFLVFLLVCGLLAVGMGFIANGWIPMVQRIAIVDVFLFAMAIVAAWIGDPSDDENNEE
jgi:hypothetical protein